MDDSEEDPDLLNEETFDCAEIGDWENEHDQFVQNFHKVSEESPTADELPKFWNDSDGLSFLWQTDDLGCGVIADDGGEKVVDVEETLQKLVSDETFEDPAILDISRKVSYQQLNEDSFQHLRNAPAYPTAPTDIFDRTRDIWSIEGSYETRYGSGKASIASDCNMKSKNVIDVLRSLNVCHPSASKTVSTPSEASTEDCLPGKHATESQIRGVDTELYSKASRSPGNLQNIVPVSQHKVYPNPVFSPGNRICQSQTIQNSLSVNNGIHPNHLRTNPFSLDILKGQLHTDVSVFPTLPAVQSVFKNIHPSKWDYSQIHGLALVRNQCILQQNPPVVSPVSSSQHNPFISSPSVRGLMLPNIQPNDLSLSSYLSRFPVQPTNAESKQSVSLSSTIIPCSKQPSGFVASLEEVSIVKESDPNRGGWMTDYEAIGVLLIQLRPLMVSNPYVQDYYFASQWLRRMNAIQAKHISKHKMNTTTSPAIVQLPIPIPLESLSDSNSSYQVTLKHKLVIPFRVVNRNPGSDQNVDESCGSLEKKSVCSETPTSESSNALGRPTRSNVHRPRVVAELSLASAISSISENTYPMIHIDNHSLNRKVDDEDYIPARAESSDVKCNRRRLLILAQIERMFSILLILDEVSLSLKRVVVQNDARSRLLDYQQELINQLISELLQSSSITSGTTSKEEFFKSVENGLFSLPENFFSIHKGMRLWCLTLHHLPTKIQTNYLSKFIHDFLRLRQLWPTTMNEAASIFYPHLREIIYQLKHINDFLRLCFPDALKMNYDSQLTIPITDNLKSLLSCKLGLSLIFCLLDACARASNPTDPSDFIQFGAYFSYANSFIDRTFINNTTDECDYVMESFPHLASILLLYIKPSKYGLLTNDHLNTFCDLATKTIKTSNNDITTTTSNNNNMNMNQQLSTGIIDSPTAIHTSVSSLSSSSLTQCCTTVSNSHNSTLSNHYHATQQQHLTMDNSAQSTNSQSSENVVSNIAKNSDDLSVSVVVG
ncbi:unnamed protein product [Schistosoma rodhaini]|uniref:Uncharacterized protein n=1 Tax=Schistosoma rodhaini TaxID=6188 RepID=A0AA85FAE5_9TREM|nr:unnamed protein product [Schistosoma rodhaini]